MRKKNISESNLNEWNNFIPSLKQLFCFPYLSFEICGESLISSTLSFYEIRNKIKDNISDTQYFYYSY